MSPHKILLCAFPQVKCCYLLKQSLKIYFLVETKTEKIVACGNKSKIFFAWEKENNFRYIFTCRNKNQRFSFAWENQKYIN